MLISTLMCVDVCVCVCGCACVCRSLSTYLPFRSDHANEHSTLDLEIIRRKKSRALRTERRARLHAGIATHGLIRSFSRSFVHSFVHSFIRSFVHSFVHSSFIRRSFVVQSRETSCARRFPSKVECPSSPRHPDTEALLELLGGNESFREIRVNRVIRVIRARVIRVIRYFRLVRVVKIIRVMRALSHHTQHHTEWAYSSMQLPVAHLWNRHF